MEENNEKFTKPSYDGRLKYYDVLKAYLIHIANAQYMGDFAGWVRLLEGYFNHIVGFIDPKEVNAIEVDIEAALNQYSRLSTNSKVSETQKNIFNFHMDRKLNKLTRKMNKAAKHLLLPIASEEITEYDFEEFKRGSDL